jgi:ABC-type glycerol-3-phosphate transport system substrate-binding protein
MSTLKCSLAPAAILLAGLLLAACGGSGNADVKTTTPSSMLGTDSAATKVGGTPVDTTRLGTGQ